MTSHTININGKVMRLKPGAVYLLVCDDEPALRGNTLSMVAQRAGCMFVGVPKSIDVRELTPRARKGMRELLDRLDAADAKDGAK